MSNAVTIVGNAGRDAELRFTASGKPVANFSVCDQPRRRTDNGWEDSGPALWLDITAWNDAEHVAEIVQKGVRVTVTGRLVADEYTTRDGETRKQVKVTAESVALHPKTQGAGWSKPAADDPWSN